MVRVLFAASLALTALVASPTTAAPPTEGTFYRIQNVNSGKFLALGDGAGKGDDIQIVQRNLGSDERQQWSFQKVGKHYRIVSRKGDQFINVRSTEDGTPVIGSINGKNAQWAVEEKGDAILLRSRHSGLVLDVADESAQRKAPVIQTAGNDGPSQLFKLVPVEN